MTAQVAGGSGGTVAVVATPAPVARGDGATVTGPPYSAPVEVTVAPAVVPPEAYTVEESDVTGPPIVVPGPPGPARSYRHYQASPAASWAINHGLGIRVVPTLRLADAPDEPVFADVRFVDDDNVTIEWPAPVAGWAEF